MKLMIMFFKKKSRRFYPRKNDMITVISEKDEHCWVGEVNGLRGWFPAKFVEVPFLYPRTETGKKFWSSLRSKVRKLKIYFEPKMNQKLFYC